MKFEARSLGVFEILAPRQESREVFDADRFRQAVNGLLERKVRQLVIDLSGVDYLYSDAINVLVSINRRILEQAGRMCLLAPQPKVHEILMRSGLDSLFRIYKSEAELSAESMELLRQSTMLSRDRVRDPNSSTGYSLAVKTPAPVPEGPRARNTRRRSGSRKDIIDRRPAGRKDSVVPLDPPEESVGSDPVSQGPASTGSAFPSAFSWDEKPVAPPTPVVAPAPSEKPASPSLEIIHGSPRLEESVLPDPANPPAPATFFPPPQALDEDMPTLEFRIPRSED
ncbi:MAG: hypothetical protein RL318_1816 [Fibrobacterota bacterium]|jgi:anti-anti-sigma factor